jgi:hypothetical protein
MATVHVPVTLRDRLGPEATAGLLEVLDESQACWSDDVLTANMERLERRLSEEVSSLRVELHNGLGAVRQEVAIGRVDHLKWSFAFWIGQLAAMAGLVALLSHRL